MFFGLVITNVQAQNYLSPFSKFGLGEQMPSSYSAQRAMGDVSIAFGDENLISATNPASYSNLTSLVFETAANAYFYQVSSSSDQFSNKDYRLPYFAFALPLDKKIGWGFSFGLRQESKIGYLFQQSYASPISYNEIYEGSGGYSKFYLGTSIRIIKNLSFGVNVGYYFGTQQINQRIDFDSVSPVSTHRDVYTNIGNLSFDFGLQYKIKTGEKSALQFGLTTTLPGSFSAHQDLYYNSFVTINGTNYVADSILKTLQASGKVIMPATYGFGVQWKNEKWLISADYKMQTWSDFRFFDRNDSLHNLSSVGVGLQYSPAGNDIYARFTERIKYRIGFRYTQTYYNINNTQPVDMRLTFGVGLPIVKSGSAVNLSFELGQLGDISKNSIRQRYMGVTVGFHLFDDNWFRKRFID